MNKNDNYVETIIKWAKKHRKTIANFDITDQEINDNIVEIIKIYRTEQQCLNNNDDDLCGLDNFHFLLTKKNNRIYLESHLCPKLKTNPNFLINNNYWYSNISLKDNNQKLSKQDILIEQSDQQKKELINLLLKIKKDKLWVNGIYVYGNAKGKSHLIIAFCNEMALKEKSIVYIVLSHFFLDIKKSITNKDSFIDDIIEKMITVDILVIDELDQDNFQNFLHNQILYPVINARNQKDKLTIFIAKRNKEDLAKLFKTKSNIQAEQFMNRIDRLIANNVFNLNKYKN